MSHEITTCAGCKHCPPESIESNVLAWCSYRELNIEATDNACVLFTDKYAKQLPHRPSFERRTDQRNNNRRRP